MLKRFVSSKWAWNLIIGPFYNRIIHRAAAEVYSRVADLIEVPEGSRVLDVGCGPACVTLELAKRQPSAQFTGVDYSSTEIEFARQAAARQGLGNIRFQLGNAMNLPFGDASFDTVFSIASIKYWPSGARGLAEIRRVLVSGGVAVIVEADQESPDEEIEHFAAAHLNNSLWKRLMRRGFREFTYSREEAVTCGREAGFTQVEVGKMAGLPFFVMRLRNEAP